MMPVNVPPIGTGGSQGVAPGTPGSYPLVLSVPSGLGPTGFNQISNPTLVQVTGLNNTINTSFSVNAPSAGGGLVANSVTFTNPGAAFGSAAGGCGQTYGQLSSLPGSPLGPSCAWSLWVDATTLNSTNTTAMAACGGGLGETGTITFNTGGFPGSALVVPLTVCVTDFPSLTLGMPNTYPNPTYGPNPNPGLNSPIAQPSNLIPGFQQSIVDMVLATSGGGTLGSTASPISLLAQAGNSTDTCKILDIRTNGGVVNNVTIDPPSVPWIQIKSLAQVQGGALFLGPGLTGGSAPNTLRWNSIANGIGFNWNGGITGFGNNNVLPFQPPFAAGPQPVVPDFQTFAICGNTDPVGNAAGTFSTTVTIRGGGVGPITVPVNLVVGNGGGTPPPPTPTLSQIGVYRPTVAPANTAAMAFFLDQSGNNAWDAGDKIRFFGNTGGPAAAQDIAVVGDWDGTGAVRFGVVHCPVGAQCTWYIDMNNNGQWDGTVGGDVAWVNFGLPGDTPVVGDWTGDGKSKIGIFRCPAAGQPGECFWILDLGNKHTYDPATVGIYRFGLAGDQPAVGNWKGGASTSDQIGVLHCPTAAASCTWIVDSIGKTGSATQPGGTEVFDPADAMFTFTAPGGFAAGDVAVVGNWNNNGKKRIGIFRSSTGVWYVDTNGNGAFDAGSDQVFSFGLPSALNPGGVPDQPVVGFWTLPGPQLLP
jgi:hypothetical protein